MCERNIELKKKYIILMDFDYTNIFKENKDLNLKNIILAIPKDGKSIPEEGLKYLKEIFAENLKFVGKAEDSMIEIIEQCSPDILLTMGWRRIISENVFDRVDLSVNIHPALLPEYKGYHPLPYLLMNDEAEHGLTAHIISKEVDAGDIISQHRFKINKFSTIQSLIDMSKREMPNFFKKLLLDIENNEISRTQQDDSKTKIVARRRTPADSELDGEKSLNQLFNEIRACDQERFPPFFYIEDEKVFVKLWRENKNKDNIYDI